MSRPEDKIRLALAAYMQEELGFPKELLSFEKSLRSLSHVEGSAPPRRFDIICFGKDIHPDYPLYPLLMVECKAGLITESAAQQVIGYNHYVRSYFIALAGQKEILLGWKSKEKGYTFRKGLLSFNELMEKVKREKLCVK